MRPDLGTGEKALGAALLEARCRSRRTRAIRSKSWAKRWAKRAARRLATQCWSGHDRLARLYRSFNGIEAVADRQRRGAVENSPPESQALAGNINEPQRANNKWGRDNDYRCCDRDHLALGSPLRDERDLRQPVSKAPFYRARLPHLSWPRGHATPCSRRPRMYRRHERASFCFSRL